MEQQMSKPNLRYIQSSEKQKIKANLFARFLKNETGRLELALIVDENTTLSDLEKAWNSIKRETNKILTRLTFSVPSSCSAL